jgi:ParB family chromosome partitioning protein
MVADHARQAPGADELFGKVRRALSERRIQLGHAELLAAVTRDKQDAVLEKLLSQASLPTVVQFRGQLEQISRALGSAIFDKGECTSCPHNSGNQQALFGEAIAQDTAPTGRV